MIAHLHCGTIMITPPWNYILRYIHARHDEITATIRRHPADAIDIANTVYGGGPYDTAGIIAFKLERANEP